MTSKLRLAFVTDMETGGRRKNRKGKNLAYGDKALTLLDKFVQACNRDKPDCVIDMGDRVANDNMASDAANIRSLSQYFNKLSAPFYAVTGNHDLVYLSRKDNEKHLGCPAYSHSKDIGDFHVVFFSPELVFDDEGRRYLTEEDLNWLEEDLRKTGKPTIIATHIGLDQDVQEALNANVGNPAYRLYYDNAHQARDIIARSGKVVLCMSGHRHTNSATHENGVHYITLQSLVQAQEGYRTRSPYAAHAFVDIHMNDDGTGEIAYQLKGRYKRRHIPGQLPIPAAS